MRWRWMTLLAGPLLALPSPVEFLVEILNRRMKDLEAAVSAIAEELDGVGTFADGDTTPYVAGAMLWQTENAGATSITGFDGVTGGKRFFLVFGDANTTLVHSATLVLASGANVTGAAGDVMQFVTADGTTWREVPT